jgi:hypothetical protein
MPERYALTLFTRSCCLASNADGSVAGLAGRLLKGLSAFKKESTGFELSVALKD